MRVGEGVIIAGMTDEPLTAIASRYLQLRTAITLVVPGDHGLAPSDELLHVWGVMVDVGLPPGPVTVVAIADGTTSLYLGNGGATVGVGVLPHIAGLARELLRSTDAAVSALVPAWELPLPPAGSVQVVALTYRGMLATRAGMRELAAGGHPLVGVWAAAGAVAGAIEALDVDRP